MKFRTICIIWVVVLLLVKCGSSSSSPNAAGAGQRVKSYTTGSAHAKAASFMDMFLTQAYAVSSAGHHNVYYNADNLISKIESVDMYDVIWTVYEFTYDVNSNISQEIIYRSDAGETPRLSEKFLLTYYADNTLQHITDIDYMLATGVEVVRYEIPYTKNADGSVTVIDGTLTKTYVYDTNGVLTHTLAYDSTTDKYTSDMTYNSLGQCIQEVILHTGKDGSGNFTVVVDSYTNTYTYNDDGTLNTSVIGYVTTAYDYTKETGSSEGADCVSILTFMNIHAAGRH